MFYAGFLCLKFAQYICNILLIGNEKFAPAEAIPALSIVELVTRICDFGISVALSAFFLRDFKDFVQWKARFNQAR